MSAKPHTAIPLQGGGWWIVADKNGDEIGSGDGGFEKDQAVLMAASTDLLEALEAVAGAWGNLPFRSPFGLKQMIDNAIAKARGQS